MSSGFSQLTIQEKTDPKVAQLMKAFVDKNKSTTTVAGWRIQIMATSDKQRMESELLRFQNLYPFVKADWVHAKPYFKVRAGAFTSKRDAMRTLHLLQNDYPTAYPIQDNDIRPEELLK